MTISYSREVKLLNPNHFFSKTFKSIFLKMLLIFLVTVMSGCMSTPKYPQGFTQEDISNGKITMKILKEMRQSDLDKLYSKSDVGPQPLGDAKGLVMMYPNLWLTSIRQAYFKLVWQGKIFERTGNSDGKVINKVYGFKAIEADLYKDKSYFDGNESLVIDYSESTLGFRRIRDEIRQIGPNLWLGRAYYKGWFGGKYLITNFALEFPEV